jgi:hypothetical protein
MFVQNIKMLAIKKGFMAFFQNVGWRMATTRPASLVQLRTNACCTLATVASVRGGFPILLPLMRKRNKKKGRCASCTQPKLFSKLSLHCHHRFPLMKTRRIWLSEFASQTKQPNEVFFLKLHNVPYAL